MFDNKHNLIEPLNVSCREEYQIHTKYFSGPKNNAYQKIFDSIVLKSIGIVTKIETNLLIKYTYKYNSYVAHFVAGSTFRNIFVL